MAAGGPARVDRCAPCHRAANGDKVGRRRARDDDGGRRALADHRRRRSLGQSVVEFALVLPVFMLLLLIAVDFGRLFFTYIELNNIAREGAAYASANPMVDNATLTTVAVRESNVQAQRGEGAITATATCAPVDCSSALGGTGAGNRVTVGVTQPFTFFTPLIGMFWPGGLQLGSSATATVADYAAGGGAPPASCTTPPPVPTFSWQSPDKINRPSLISVDASGAPNLAAPCQNVTYEWDFGGTSNASPPDPNDPYREGITQDYTYAAAGTYSVTLTVTNAYGSTSSAPKTISLGTTTCNGPTASFTVTPTSGAAANPGGQHGTTFNFDATHSGFMTDTACHPVWAWDFGDGTPASSVENPSHVFPSTKSGKTVTVTLTVTNDAGSNSTTVDIKLS